MELSVIGTNGESLNRQVTLPDDVFAIEPNDHVIWLDIRREEANRRQGTHQARDRGETAGSTRKLYRQKGTGSSRAGSSKSPLRRSGGTTFGPRPRDYGFKVNRKTQKLARRSAIAYKLKNDAIVVVEDFTFDKPETKRLIKLLAALDLADKHVVILTNGSQAAVHQSCGNLPKVLVREATAATTRDLSRDATIVLQEGAVAPLTDVLSGKKATPVD